MFIVAVDDEELMLQALISKVKKILPDCKIKGYTNPRLAAQECAVMDEKLDVAFLDIEMFGLNGIDLADMFEKINPKVNIIFVSGYSEYAIEAIKLHASGYLIKPVDEAQLKKELSNLRYPVTKKQSLVTIHTFGNFEIFKDEVLVKFPRTKCKELLAYLIDRNGASVTIGEISAILWEDKPNDKATQNLTQKIISDMMKTLKEEDIEYIIIKEHNSMAIDKSKVDCDYYELLDGDANATKQFMGEYMTNYEWGETTLSSLSTKFYN